MENIDDFMQRKFDSEDPSERFPFREEYWEQAQALIEADERRRKRRRLLLWWLFSGMLAGIAAVWLWHGQTTTTPGAVMTDTPEHVRTARPGTQNATSDLRETPAASNKTSENTGETTSENTRGGSMLQPENAAEKQELQTENQRNGNNKTVMKDARSSRNLPGATVKMGGKPQKNNLQTNVDSGSGTQNAAAVIHPPAHSGQPNENQATPSSIEPVVNDAIPATDPKNAEQEAIIPEQIRLFEVLELPFLPARHSKSLLLKKVPTAVRPEIKPVRTPRFAWEAGAAASVWKAGTGFAGGATGSYRLKGHWSVAAGVQMRYVPLSSGVEPVATDSSENVSVKYRYSFGLERTETRRLLKSTLNLEIPISAHWQKGRFGWSAGVAPGILLGVGNRIVQTQETTLGGIKTIDEYPAKGSKTGFENTYISLFSAAEWRLLPHLGLSLQGNFRPGSILKPSEATVPEKNFWCMDFGVRWHF